MSFQSAGLAPALDQRADYYRWLFFAAGPLEQALVNRYLGVELTQEQQLMAGYGSYEKTVSVLAELLESSTYIAGDSFSAADVYLGSQVVLGLLMDTLPKLSPFERYAERLTSRPAWSRVERLEGALQASPDG